MAPDSAQRNAQLNPVIVQLYRAGVQMQGPNVKWHLTKSYSNPVGFDFTCDNPLILQRMAESSKRMVRDLDYPTPAGLDDLRQYTVGFTELGEGMRVHLDVAIAPTKLCRLFVANARSRSALGRSWNGDAVVDLKGPVVVYVKGVALQKGLKLDDYGCRVVKIYNNGVEPKGFDFRCKADGVRRLMSYVSSLASFKFDDPKDKLEGGWFNQIATKGSGYREKGYGPRLHIELVPEENFGNVHVDSHGFVREDGSYDWHEAATHHGPEDLVSGYVGGRIGSVGWLPYVQVQYTRDPGHDTTVVGLPNETNDPIDPTATDISGSIGRGTRVTIGARFRFQ